MTPPKVVRTSKAKTPPKRKRAPAKSPVTVNPRVVEAWLEAEGGPLRTSRGRPRAGEIPLIPMLQERFGVSRRTAHRLLVRIAQRRRTETARLPIDPSQAAMVAALSARYRTINVPGNAAKNAPPTIRVMQSPVPQQLTPTGSGVKRPLIPPLVTRDGLAEVVLRALRDWPDQSLPREAQQVLARKLGVEPPVAGRGLEALGLRTVPGHSLQMKGMPHAPARLVTEALQEALEAYGSTVRPVGALADAVAHLLAALRG